MTTLNDSKFNSLNNVHQNNQLTGTNVMPMKGESSDNQSSFSTMRQIFQRSNKNHPTNDTQKRGKNALYQDGSQYIAKLKSAAIGKQQYNPELKFNSNPKNDSINALKRVRSSSYRPPSKV
jgi:hypothetical protein